MYARARSFVRAVRTVLGRAHVLSVDVAAYLSPNFQTFQLKTFQRLCLASPIYLREWNILLILTIYGDKFEMLNKIAEMF